MGDIDEARRYLAKAKDVASVTEELTDLDDCKAMRELARLFLRIAEISSQIAQTDRLGQMQRDAKAATASMSDIMSDLKERFGGGPDSL